MSFEDTIDMYRDQQVIERAERAERFKRRQPELEQIRRAGYLCTTLSNGAQWRVRAGWVDFWPSTGKWINRRTAKHGRLADERPVLDLIREQIGPVK